MEDRYGLESTEKPKADRRYKGKNPDLRRRLCDVFCKKAGETAAGRGNRRCAIGTSFLSCA